MTSGAITHYHSQILPNSKFEPEKGRYCLFTSNSCPYAHRTEIVRKLKGLDHLIEIKYCDPIYRFKQDGH